MDGNAMTGMSPVAYGGGNMEYLLNKYTLLALKMPYSTLIQHGYTDIISLHYNPPYPP